MRTPPYKTKSGLQIGIAYVPPTNNTTVNDSVNITVPNRLDIVYPETTNWDISTCQGGRPLPQPPGEDEPLILQIPGREGAPDALKALRGTVNDAGAPDTVHTRVHVLDALDGEVREDAFVVLHEAATMLGVFWCNS